MQGRQEIGDDEEGRGDSKGRERRKTKKKKEELREGSNTKKQTMDKTENSMACLCPSNGAYPAARFFFSQETVARVVGVAILIIVRLTGKQSNAWFSRTTAIVLFLFFFFFFFSYIL